ncbi:hypothetical protein NZD89_01965 [Alicyclobacillus fastidiosus]|uniref:Uncharacterized protein n=1 Tax=Alicyclobacillus fastidiosus TaxID=392011 RepID=A0ABY6ZHR4_9BACL|nr:hypothetical protein [Alicyclobacillus fastidiosus]WAH42295.1 hypothetical protein NZD89_01965 [Alicyclobacillus fastidiosus]GMA64102.1 hypothetical protein GCM10025859_45420 [Alicyclobacillus fastidiosus]
MLNRLRQRVWLAALSSTVVAFGALWFSLSVQARSGPVETPPASTTLTKYLPLYATGENWFGKPVYKVTNTSGMTLHHVTLSSFSGELLPVLFVGVRHGPLWPASAHELLHAPFTLKPGASMWFVGPRVPPIRLGLTWMNEDNPHFEILEPAS